VVSGRQKDRGQDENPRACDALVLAQSAKAEVREMIVGGYQLDLYCDTEPSCPHANKFTSVQAQYVGQTERECLKQARKDGWKFKKDNTLCYCPGCAR
jgi:hypothetical protein